MSSLQLLAHDLISLVRSANGAQPDYQPRLLDRYLQRCREKTVADSGSDDPLEHYAAGRPWAQAPLLAVAEGLGPADEYWIRADPVSLQADISRVFLVREQAPELSMEEANELAAALQPDFAEQGLQLHQPAAGRWYLSGPQNYGLGFPPPQRSLAVDLSAVLPQQAKSSPWKRLMNISQMAWHEHPINRHRAAAGLPPVNSLWFWGGGCLPAGTGTVISGLVGRSRLIRGAAAHYRLPRQERLSQVAQSGNWLAEFKATSEPAVDQLSEFQERWLAVALAGLKRRLWNHITLYPGNGCSYRLQRSSWLAFWRRNSILRDWQA